MDKHNNILRRLHKLLEKLSWRINRPRCTPGRIQELHLDAELYWSSFWVEEHVFNEVMKSYFSFAARKGATVPPGFYLNSLIKLFNTIASVKQLELS